MVSGMNFGKKKIPTFAAAMEAMTKGFQEVVDYHNKEADKTQSIISIQDTIRDSSRSEADQADEVIARLLGETKDA